MGVRGRSITTATKRGVFSILLGTLGLPGVFSLFIFAFCVHMLSGVGPLGGGVLFPPLFLVFGLQLFLPGRIYLPLYQRGWFM